MASAKSEGKPTTRLLSLDVYRGLVMLLLATNGLGLAQSLKDSDGSLAQWIVFHGTHPQWNSQFAFVGVSMWDLIQPAFMFIVGVSMPFSYEKRARLGQSYGRRMGHAWTRAVILVLLGVFLQSLRRPETNWLFTNVLSQIGLGYGFLFFLVGRTFRTQFFVGGAILLGYYFAMVLLPRGLESFAAHFADGTSFPQQFDLWFLNLFPRAETFTGHPYATLNFIPSLVTMLMGLMSGQLLKSKELSESTKIKRLLVVAAVCLALGAIAGLTFCPIVKKLWTPSWTLYSGGYALALLALFYWVIDVKGLKGWVFPFVVVGLNPLAIYLLEMMGRGAVHAAFKRHLPEAWFAGAHGYVVLACLTATLFWLILLWMYRNRIFLRI